VGRLGCDFGEQTVKCQGQPAQKKHRREIAYRWIYRKRKIEAIAANRNIVDNKT